MSVKIPFNKIANSFHCEALIEQVHRENSATASTDLTALVRWFPGLVCGSNSRADINFALVCDIYLHSAAHHHGAHVLLYQNIPCMSPYGNIFKTKQLADKEKAKKLLQEEMDEMRFEEQFRGGDMHGFNRGGIMKDVVPPLDEYAAGGVGRLILKQAPKVINKLREFAPQITGKPGKPADLKSC